MARRIAVLFFLLASVAVPTRASKLDQSYVPPSEPLLDSWVGDMGNGDKAEEAQTFRVGIQGRLTGVDLYLQGYGDGSGLLLEIHRTTPNGLPSDAPGDLLGAAISLTKGPVDRQFVAFNLGDQGPQVQTGEQLALVLKAPGSGSYEWYGMPGNPYTQGIMSTRSTFLRQPVVHTRGYRGRRRPGFPDLCRPGA